MSPLVPIGLAIVLNAGILTAGVVWSKRQVKRVAAERTASYRALFKLEPLPPPGEAVRVLVEDEDDGRTSEIDAVHWPHLGWTDAVTLLRVEGDVLGWRRHPFGSHGSSLPAHPADDPANWSRERLEAELAKLTSDDKHL